MAALAPKDKAAAAFPLLSGDVVAWTVVAAPSEGWARAIFGAPELERLWAAVAQATRLDRPDPVVAWREHLAELGAGRPPWSSGALTPSTSAVRAPT